MLNLYKLKNAQQGYILVVALLVMLFIGAIVISTVTSTSTEERVATSNLHLASLESALYQGLYTVEAQAKKTDLSGETNPVEMCNEIYSDLNTKLKGVVKNFQTNSPESADVYWKLAGLNESCADYKVRVNLVAWQGNENSPIAKLEGRGQIYLDKVSDGSVGNGPADTPTGEVKELAGVSGSLKRIMGDNVATSSGTVKASLVGARIEGNIKAKEIKSTWFGRIKSDKKEIDKSITDDPLKLANFINNSFFYTDKTKKDEKKLTALTPKEFKFKSSTGSFDRNIGVYPITRGVITPEGLTVYNAKDSKDIEVIFPFYEPVDPAFLGRVECCNTKINPGCDKNCPAIKLAVLDKLTVNRGGVWVNRDKPTLRISGGDVVIYVKGDVWLGGFSKLHIDNDSSLTLIVDGVFTMSDLFEFTNKNITNNKGAPLFTLLSNGNNNNRIIKAVNIMGIRPLYGMIYSVSDITVSGFGDIQGQVFGKNITATLGGSIGYREFGRVSDDDTAGDSSTDTGDEGGGGSDQGTSSDPTFTPKLDVNFEINY